MRRYGVLILLSIATVALAAETPLKVPSDPKAKYYVLEKSGAGTDRVILTKRVGPSGTSYSRRLYNCSNSTFKYLADADTLEGLKKAKPDPKMGPLVEGSISYYVGLEACKGQ